MISIETQRNVQNSAKKRWFSEWELLFNEWYFLRMNCMHTVNHVDYFAQSLRN
jgi:hypothetical protein